MKLKEFFKSVLGGLSEIENKMAYSSRFSQCEINEMLRTAKQENIPFLQELIEVNKLTAFEITFLLNSANLSAEKIDTIKAAVELYDEAEFRAAGQTLSDFIFRVAANLDILDTSNLTLFKELVRSKNELYDFSGVLERPRFTKSRETELAFAFERTAFAGAIN